MSRSSVTGLVLTGQPSCIEVVPNNPQHAIIGTYELRESRGHEESQGPEAQERTGSLQLIRFTETSITVVEVVNEEYGILDLHFSPYHSAIICTANSTGSLTFRNVTEDSDIVSISQHHVKTVVVTDNTSILVLSLQWHPKDHRKIACTLSNGQVFLVTLNVDLLLRSLQGVDQGAAEESVITAAQVVLAHSLEAWISAFTPSGDAILSGGDDCLLQYATIQSAHQEAENADPQSVWTNRKIHGAGVTAILPLDETTFVTGSYDDHIRIIDSANGRPQVLAELNLGGGLWRLKRMTVNKPDGHSIQENNSVLLLASCMHDGAKIVKAIKINDDTWTLGICDRFEEHQSMNYGSDFVMQDGGQQPVAVISTSFYDRLVCLWYASPP